MTVNGYCEFEHPLLLSTERRYSSITILWPIDNQTLYPFLLGSTTYLDSIGTFVLD